MPAPFAPTSEREEWEVTAYLVAITPDIQKSTKKKQATSPHIWTRLTNVLYGKRSGSSPSTESPNQASGAKNKNSHFCFRTYRTSSVSGPSRIVRQPKIAPMAEPVTTASHGTRVNNSELELLSESSPGVAELPSR